MMALKKVLLAYDGSENSRKALEWLLNFAPQTTILTVIVKVLEFPGYIESGLDEVVKLMRENQEEQMEKLTEVFTQKELAAKTIVLDGDPAARLIEYATKERVDLVICGTRGMGGFESLLLGSVAHKLVTHSPVPVLVIK